MLVLKALFRLWAVLCVAAGAGTGAGQPFGLNVDIDAPGTPPQAGGGRPSSSFAAAGGQPGYWNAIPLLHQGPLPLFGLGGEPTTAALSMAGGYTGLAYNLPINTGDFALLLNDATQIGEFLRYTVSGLEPGRYIVYTYSAKPNGQYGEADITVLGATAPNPQRVSGIMPGNRLEYLLTHSIHEVDIQGGELQIRSVAPWPNGFINGFQIVPVTEPCALLALAALSVALVSSKTRRKMRRTGVE